MFKLFWVATSLHYDKDYLENAYCYSKRWNFTEKQIHCHEDTLKPIARTSIIPNFKQKIYKNMVPSFTAKCTPKK